LPSGFARHTLWARHCEYHARNCACISFAACWQIERIKFGYCSCESKTMGTTLRFFIDAIESSVKLIESPSLSPRSFVTSQNALGRPSESIAFFEPEITLVNTGSEK